MGENAENHIFQPWGVRGWKGGGRKHRARQPLIACGGGGGGEVRVTVLALHAALMHVDLSFSYLRSAATASFDKKEFHRNCTDTKTVFSLKKLKITFFLKLFS